MSETTGSRIYDLIEELRAEIDFELEDVITEIVRDLPEDYFQRIKRKDQMTHLRALLALSICKLQEELMFRSSDGVHIAVIAKQNYSGQLANILQRLPDNRVLTGAKIFTSRNHDFIIDLFEFEPDPTRASNVTAPELPATSRPSPSQTVIEIAAAVQQPVERITDFLSHYSPTSEIHEYPKDMAEHFFAAQEVQEHGCPSIRTLALDQPNQIKMTIASRKIRTRELVFLIAEFLGRQNIDIGNAYLNDLLFEGNERIAIASFEIECESCESFEPSVQAIRAALTQHVQTDGNRGSAQPENA